MVVNPSRPIRAGCTSLFYGRRILDLLALIVCTRLTASLLQLDHETAGALDIHFFDEGALCVECAQQMSWRRDGFHPAEAGYAVLAERCKESIQKRKTMVEIQAEKLKLLADMAGTPSVSGFTKSFVGILVTVALAVPFNLLLLFVNTLILLHKNIFPSYLTYMEKQTKSSKLVDISSALHNTSTDDIVHGLSPEEQPSTAENSI